MGGSKDSRQGSTRKLLPRTQSMGNLSKVAYIREELEQDVSRSGPMTHLHYFRTMAVFMVLIPPLELLVRRVREKITQLLFDFSILTKLEEASVINWCSAAKKLYPLFTRGDGNCLPHAVSLYLWGIHDDELFLRRLIYRTLTDTTTSDHFRARWKHAKRYMNSTIPEGGVQYDSQEWDQEWAMVIDLTSDIRQDDDPNALPYRSLEEIHIFALANIIRRPIIVMSEGVIRRIDGSSLAPNYIGGIYLPTLCNSKECIKSPVVLCYDSNHFVPLLSMEEPNQPSSSAENVVPIVTSKLENLPVHLLLESEETQVTQLLEKYLNLVEVKWTKKDEVDEVLAVAIQQRKLPDDLNVMNDFCAIIESDILSEQQSKEAKTETVRNITSNAEMHEEQAPPHRRVGGSYRPNPGGEEMESPPDTGTSRPVENKSTGEEERQENTAESLPLAYEAQRLAAMESQPCITPGCEFHGLPENGGRCSGCVKEYSKNTRGGLDEETAEKVLHESPPMARPRHQARGDASLRRSASCREKSSRTKSEEPMPFPLLEECASPGCSILASKLTPPYCMKHHPRGMIISTVKEDKERASNSIGAYYATHVTPESSPEPRHESHSLESVLVHFPKKCLAGGCLDNGDPRKRNMCSRHYEEYSAYQQSKKESTKQISFAPNAESSRTYRIDNTFREQERQSRNGFALCSNTRCAKYGLPSYQGYCQECFKHHVPAETKGTNFMDKTRMDTERVVAGSRELCRNRRCGQWGESSLQGYCRICYRNMDTIQNQQNEQEQNLMETFGQKPTERPKSWAPNAATAAKVGLLVDIGQANSELARGRIKSTPSPTKPSNLTPYEQSHQRAKRSHHTSATEPYGQQELPEKTRRTFDATQSQFSQYRQPQESLEPMEGSATETMTKRESTVKTRHTFDTTLPQFSQYRNPQESMEDISQEEPRPCKTDGCCGVQLKGREYCYRCDSKRTQRALSAATSPEVSTRIGDVSPPLAHSSGVEVFTNDPVRSSHAEENTSYEREMLALPKCTFTACFNRGLDINNGLCQECFDLLAATRVSARKTPVASPSLTSIIATPGLSITSVRRHCKALGCDMYGTPETNDYCSQCYTKSLQSFQEERQRDYGQWHSDPISPIDTRPSSEPISPSIVASHCQNHHCNRYGDPAYNGYCSTCYDTSIYRHRQDVVPVSYAPPVFPPISQSPRTREPSYQHERVSFVPDRMSIAKCKNYYLTNCPNYGNTSCKGYCNNCYIERRLSMY